ncbi:MAG: PhzF family phenazine biosynthesis isomerase [Polyangiaceae bacterium]
MATIPCFQVDAFARAAFTGNPAAVCPLSQWLDDRVMQSIAAENALSETAFFVKNGDVYDLRWFTPENEVDLCGHATLASAHVLMTVVHPELSSVRFISKSGPLDVRRVDAATYEMDFPSRPPQPTETPSGLFAALGITSAEVLLSRDLVVVLERAEDVRALRVDSEAIRRLGVFAVCVTAPGSGVDADVDFVSRFFAPNEGIPEDPVTGSAHCSLVPYWSARLSKTLLRARQVSRRTGELECELVGGRVLLRGGAVTTRTGSFVLPDEVVSQAGVERSMTPGVIAVIFTSHRHASTTDGYAAMASAMETLAHQQPGFLGIESARGDDGVGITVSYWASERDVLAWKQLAAHRVAQDRGKQSWYTGFKMRVCRVERAYSFGDLSRF